MIVEITINWLPQFRKSIVFETELTKKMFILTIIFYSVMVCKILKIRNMRNKGTLTKNGMYTHGKLEKNKKNNAQNDPLKNLH